MRGLRGGRARGRVGRWRPLPPVGSLGRGMISAWRPCSATTPTSVASWMWPARWLCTLSSIGPTSGCVRTRRTCGRRGGDGAGDAGLGWAGGGPPILEEGGPGDPPSGRGRWIPEVWLAPQRARLGPRGRKTEALWQRRAERSPKPRRWGDARVRNVGRQTPT